ncbi:hypothetical protein FRC01_013996, partial [Tulasnella sp. 417]
MSSLTSSSAHEEETQPLPYAAANLDDRSSISPVLAARICTSVLDHVLYLNGQIPFPVQGLSRLKLDGKANVKAAKKRDELVAALDLLSSHLPSTLQSLSWALATNPKLFQATSSSATTEVDVVLVTGPSPTTVRSRCFIRLKDFSISRYGERQQAPPSMTPATTNSEAASAQGPANPPAQTQTCSPVVPPIVEVEDNGEEDDHNPEVDASFASFISDMSSALSSAAEEEERSEDEGTGDEEDEEEEDDAEESDASSSLASEEEEEEEEEESDEDCDDEEDVEEEEPALLEEDDAA